MRFTHILPAGCVLTVTAGDALCSVQQVENSTVGATLLPQSSRTFGPYLTEHRFEVSGDGVTAAQSTADLGERLAGALILADDAPVNAARASLAVNPAGDDNALTFTARAYGVEGNRITVGYVDPAANDAALSVSVSGNTISVSLATGADGAITSTAANVKAAIEAHLAANRLVSVAVDATDTGLADDGSGVVTAMAAAPLTGGVGTAVGVALPGCLLIDTAHALVYRNSGTQTAPAWTKFGDAA